MKSHLPINTMLIAALSIGSGYAEMNDTPVWVTARANFIAGGGDDPVGEGHAHDPQEDVNMQGLDLGLNLQPYNWLSGFFNINAFETIEGELDAEWEEGFLKFSELPGGLEVRAGRYLNRIGTQNASHLHAWDFVDANLSTVAMLGEEGLATNGVELTYFLPLGDASLLFSASYGEAVSHDHAHGEEGHDDDHDEDHDEDHGHEEEGGFEDEIFVARALLSYNITDFHQNRLGLNYAATTGGEDHSLFGVDYTYTWRENGLEAGGASLALTNEFFLSDVDGQESNSYMFSGVYRFASGWAIGGRYEYLDYPEELEEGLYMTEKRERLAAMISYTHDFNEDWSGVAKVQYNHDKLDGGDTSNNAWFQLGLSFGRTEIR